MTPPESQRLQQLLHEANLGDRTPSQLLRHMQQSLGSKVDGLDSLLLREIFLQKIPPNVRMVMTASNENDLSKLAELADKLMAVAPTSVAAVTSEPSPHEQLREMKNDISRLVDSVAAVHTASRSTSQSATQSPMKRQKLCWYHRKFGNATRKCVLPCELSGNAPGRR
nr:uncharacterized protein LOC126537200 [Dermacentor andersoni]